MGDAHDPDLRARLTAAATAEGIDLPQGVYAWFSGPSFETPAEIRAARILGADAVGMSTVPEVILARFLGLRVAAISTITNMGAGLSDEKISHDHTKAMAPIGAAKLEAVLRRALRDGLSDKGGRCPLALTRSPPGYFCLNDASHLPSFRNKYPGGVPKGRGQRPLADHNAGHIGRMAASI